MRSSHPTLKFRVLAAGLALTACARRPTQPLPVAPCYSTSSQASSLTLLAGQGGAYMPFAWGSLPAGLVGSWTGPIPPNVMGGGLFLIRNVNEWDAYVASSLLPSPVPAPPVNFAAESILILVGGGCSGGLSLTQIRRSNCSKPSTFDVDYEDIQGCCGAVPIWQTFNLTAYSVPKVIETSISWNMTYVPWVGPMCM